MTVNTKRDMIGAGRAAAHYACERMAITTIARELERALGREPLDLAVDAQALREGFAKGFAAWEAASEQVPHGVACGVEHWVRRALAERSTLIGGRLRPDVDGGFAVLDDDGRGWAEAWIGDGGAWSWQVELGDGSTREFETGREIGTLVDVLVREWSAEQRLGTHADPRMSNPAHGYTNGDQL
jgi:hypothetical protein